MNSENLKKDLEFFKKNQEELVKKHGGKFLIIKNQEVVGIYDTEIEAYKEAQSKYELGSFLIQECRSGKDIYTQTFHSRVIMK